MVGMGLRRFLDKKLSLCQLPELLLPRFLLFALVSSDGEQGAIRREMPAEDSKH